MDSKQKVLKAIEWFDGVLIELLWIEYAGGGMVYEFRLSKNRKGYVSDMGYGSPEAAFKDAFDYLLTEDFEADLAELP